MERLLETIIELASNSPPDKIEQLAHAVRGLSNAHDTKSLLSWAVNPVTKTRLDMLIAAWRNVDIPGAELAGMLVGAATTYHHVKAEQEIELVWTGPSSTLIATRKTEQALLQVIDAARSRLFITSFVAYNVASIMAALDKAIGRGVALTMLLEASNKDGGGVSIDGLGKMKKALPRAAMLSWVKKNEGFSGGKVHAKVAVADEAFCFISSANLTGHAMERNMEAGVLIRGGALPRDLHRHLEALETTQVISRV
ncbi:DISARM system phospholipase D-like protein DrmC [Leptospira interrogans]